jgi:hypothetical protein
MGKRVESGRDGVLVGGSLAQNNVYIWVMSDEPVLTRIRRIMAGEDSYRGDLSDREARVLAFVHHILYADDGSAYRATWRAFYGEPVSGFDPNMPRNIRTDFTRTDFDLIDWARLCRDLVEDGK